MLSNFSRQCLINAYRQSSDKIIVIPGGVDINKFVPAINKNTLRDNLALPKDKIILLTARRLAARMGLENLIYAIKKVSKSNRNIFLVIIGDGFLRAKLKEIIKQENLERYIVLQGPVNMEKIPVYYQASDVFIMPTEHDEWFGLVTIEALSCGVPVLGTPIGGIAEILTNIDKNLLFSGTSSSDMAAGIFKFLENKNAFITNSHNFRAHIVEKYSWEIVCKKTEKVYYALRRP
ncbi:MAG: glycosyltransferase family 4 protein [Candidatus Omnitrophota bacterium]